MHDFKFRNNQLYCEDVKLTDVAEKFGTPVFVYSKKTLLDHLHKLQKAFAEIPALVCYSMKANSNLSICRLLAREGAGVDIVSGGELFRAKKIKVRPDRIVYASVGKTEAEIEEAIKTGILFFNVESIPELELINKVAGRLGKKQKVAIRVNPDIDARTHAYITTAKKQNKFGVDVGTVKKIFFELAVKLRYVEICCLHLHIGSQIEHVTPFVQAVKKGVNLAREINDKGGRITHINIGGGLGIIYCREKPQTAQAYARAILPILKKSKLRLILEPGRFIVGNAGVMLTRIQYVKDTSAKRFYIVDAAMNDLVRPALYGAHHEIVPLIKKTGKLSKADVVGPVCESGDFLAKDRRLPSSLKRDELLAVMSAGAYGFSMSSNYNSRRRAAEVLIDAAKVSLIRERETYNDLIRNEVIDG